nr:Retrovirus-related Pol polyprotein from transposon TNT 1-94 [Ipomoea batatas]
MYSTLAVPAIQKRAESMVIAAVITEANVVGDLEEWVVDTGASCHFCSNKDLFKKLEPASEGEQVYMGNSSVSENRVADHLASEAMVLGRGTHIMHTPIPEVLEFLDDDLLGVPTWCQCGDSGVHCNSVDMCACFSVREMFEFWARVLPYLGCFASYNPVHMPLWDLVLLAHPTLQIESPSDIVLGLGSSVDSSVDSSVLQQGSCRPFFDLVYLFWSPASRLHNWL